MKAKQNQSAIDLATQQKGDAKAVLALCIANEISVTEALSPGSEIKEYSSIFNNEIVTGFLDLKNINLATSKEKAEEQYLGIGTMIIGTNFDVK